MDSAKEIRDRTFRFGCDVARLVLNLAPTPGIRVLIDQLLRAGTAVGANLEEAKAASTKREFLRGVEISLREAREAWFWLRIYEVLGVGDSERIRQLVAEADSLIRILTAIVISTKRRLVAIRVLSAFCILIAVFLLS